MLMANLAIFAFGFGLKLRIRKLVPKICFRVSIVSSCFKSFSVNILPNSPLYSKNQQANYHYRWNPEGRSEMLFVRIKTRHCWNSGIFTNDQHTLYLAFRGVKSTSIEMGEVPWQGMHLRDSVWVEVVSDLLSKSMFASSYLILLKL